MANMLYRTTKYINVEDAVTTERGRSKKWEKYDNPHLERGRKAAQTSDRRDEQRSRPPLGRITNFTPLNAPLNQVLMQIKDDSALTWPNKLKGDPNKRLRNKYCHFHRNHRHDTFDCYDLKQQIKALIRQGKLQQFVGRERAGENPPRDQELNQQVKERPRAPLGEIKVIIDGARWSGPRGRQGRPTYDGAKCPAHQSSA